MTDFLAVPARQAAVLEVVDHRPWPLLSSSWIQAQTWEHLLFAHWRVPEEALRAHVPEQLALESFDGSHWLGVTPFRISGLRLRGTFPVPRLSSFLELNVRTYVTYEDKPGIWFFSLDAESRLAVEAARRLYRLPYHHARMSAARRGDWIDYSSAREGGADSFSASFRATGPPGSPAPGTLEYFLAERYCLYTEHEGCLYRAEIHHPPWSLQRAEAEIHENTMPPREIELPGRPLLHFSQRQDVVIWALEPA